MPFENGKRQRLFHLAREAPGGAASEDKRGYRIRFEKSLLVSLSTAILVFLVSKHMPVRRLKIPSFTGIGISTVDMIPNTRQGSMSRPPDRPVVPIPSEDEYLPDDETIETTELDLLEGIALFDTFGSGGPAAGFGGGTPKPILEVPQRYPLRERRRGVEGVVVLSLFVNARGNVDSVRVLDNTTGSEVLRDAAMEAAYASRYEPARREGKRVPSWFERLYRFEIGK